MPTYKVVLESKRASALLVKAAVIDFSDPTVVIFKSDEDQHIIAAVPTQRVLYIVDEANGRRVAAG